MEPVHQRYISIAEQTGEIELQGPPGIESDDLSVCVCVCVCVCVFVC